MSERPPGPGLPSVEMTGELIMSRLAITTYPIQPPACVEYDPRVVKVAHEVVRMISAALPRVTVEHIGSTSVPGCAGKGIIDLMVLYPDGQLEEVKEALRGLGLQPQTVGHLMPESRPMRVGAARYQGRTYRLHVHVIAAHSPEVETLRAFRDRLRTSRQAVESYVEQKRAILAAGVTDSRAYTTMKSAFIQKALASRASPTASRR
jgi:GrpB-like predicted nucleotidyltransferase (UPF0157 family)